MIQPNLKTTYLVNIHQYQLVVVLQIDLVARSHGSCNLLDNGIPGKPAGV